MEHELVEQAVRDEEMDENLINGKSVYTKIGITYAIFGIMTFILQMGFRWIAQCTNSEILDSWWFTWVNLAVPTYIIGVPLVFFQIKNMEVTPLKQNKIGFGRFLCCICMISAICVIGSVIGTPINLGIVSIFGGDISKANEVGNLMMSSSAFPRILVVGFCAPVFEELLFRKFLIDRTVKYGEWVAIFASGLMFGLFHGNFAQFFFAMGLGMFFAFIYIRTGKIWYTMLFHAIINLSSAAVMVTLYQKLDLEKYQQLAQMDMQSQEAQTIAMQVLPPMLLLLGWIGIIFIIALVGLILLICFRKRFFVVQSENEMPRKGRFSKGFFNWGILSFCFICIFMFIYYYASIILS